MHNGGQEGDVDEIAATDPPQYLDRRWTDWLLLLLHRKES